MCRCQVTYKEEITSARHVIFQMFLWPRFEDLCLEKRGAALSNRFINLLETGRGMLGRTGTLSHRRKHRAHVISKRKRRANTVDTVWDSRVDCQAARVTRKDTCSTGKKHCHGVPTKCVRSLSWKQPWTTSCCKVLEMDLYTVHSYTRMVRSNTRLNTVPLYTCLSWCSFSATVVNLVTTNHLPCS